MSRYARDKHGRKARVRKARRAIVAFVPRRHRQADAPVSRGMLCDWCLCSDCQHGNPNYNDWLHSTLMDDGSRMCDVCWAYPPCGESGDCATFHRTGACEHRPKRAEGAVWESFEDVLAKMGHA